MASSSSSLSSSSNHKKKHGVSKSMEMEEIVRYMSNLPSYLERGKPVQDRALSFGVLDWGRLEQWQYHHQKPSVTTTNNNSPSGSTSRVKKSSNQLRTKPRTFKTNNLDPEDLVESRSSDDAGSFQTASSSSSSSKGKMKIEDSSLDPKNEIVNRRNSKTDPKNETVNRKNSKTEADSKDLGFKTGSKNLFSFSMSSKLASTKLAPRTLEPPPGWYYPPEDSKLKAKVKMDLGNCKEVKVDNSCRNKIKDSSSVSVSSASSSISSASSSLSSSLPSTSSPLSSSSSSSSSRARALCHMTVKAGRLLFTFSVDDKGTDILAATVTPLTGKDDKNSWVYTFFTIHEVKKKKTGWVYRSIKDNGNGYLSNVTARMMVSNPSISNGATREFVLTAVDSGHSGQPDQSILDVELKHELAGIVVRFLTKSDEKENGDCFSMTVVLPGGHHSIPRKGEPSPLIERWRSGGRCDCGGWDVGCRLRTLTNSGQGSRRSNPPESFDLFLQGDVINERPFFSLSPMKDGLCSVNYNTSLPLLHAFSICISVIECRKSSRHMELKTYVAKQVDEDEAPVTHASLPPVGRV